VHSHGGAARQVLVVNWRGQAQLRRPALRARVRHQHHRGLHVGQACLARAQRVTRASRPWRRRSAACGAATARPTALAAGAHRVVADDLDAGAAGAARGGALQQRAGRAERGDHAVRPARRRQVAVPARPAGQGGRRRLRPQVRPAQDALGASPGERAAGQSQRRSARRSGAGRCAVGAPLRCRQWTQCPPRSRRSSPARPPDGRAGPARPPPAPAPPAFAPLAPCASRDACGAAHARRSRSAGKPAHLLGALLAVRAGGASGAGQCDITVSAPTAVQHT